MRISLPQSVNFNIKDELEEEDEEDPDFSDTQEGDQTARLNMQSHHQYHVDNKKVFDNNTHRGDTQH